MVYPGIPRNEEVSVVNALASKVMDILLGPDIAVEREQHISILCFTHHRHFLMLTHRACFICEVLL